MASRKDQILCELPKELKKRFSVSVESVDGIDTYKLDIKPGKDAVTDKREAMAFAACYQAVMLKFQKMGIWVGQECKRPGKEFTLQLREKDATQ